IWNYERRKFFFDLIKRLSKDAGLYPYDIEIIYYYVRMLVVCMFTEIPEGIIDNIRRENDIVEVIEEYVQLKKQGRNYFGLCPFHNENSPSFSVTKEKQIFHCFGCGKGGNVITFL